jgi:hypothetical protein
MRNSAFIGGVTLCVAAQLLLAVTLKIRRLHDFEAAIVVQLPPDKPRRGSTPRHAAICIMASNYACTGEGLTHAGRARAILGTPRVQHSLARRRLGDRGYSSSRLRASDGAQITLHNLGHLSGSLGLGGPILGASYAVAVAAHGAGLSCASSEAAPPLHDQ